MAFLGLDSFKWFVISVVAVAVTLTLFGLSIERMYVLWPNIITYIVLVLVGSTVGFVIYGLIKGFKNTFPND